MMEAIGQNSPIESTLDVAQNIKNDETNFKLNVVENSPHDGEDEDENNHVEDDEDEVIEVQDKKTQKTSLTSQIVIIEDEDKKSQASSSNGPNKQSSESCEEEEAPHKEEVVINHDDEVEKQVEEDTAKEVLGPETSQLQHSSIETANQLTEIVQIAKENDSPVNENQLAEQHEETTDEAVKTNKNLENTNEQRTVNKDENKTSENRNTITRSPPQIVDVTEDSDEDELLKSDDEEIKEPNEECLDNKENDNRTLRIEIEDSLDSINNDDDKNESAVEIINCAGSIDPTASLNRTTSSDDDKKCMEEDNINDKAPVVQNANTISHDETEMDKDIVSISDEDSNRSMEEENREEAPQQQGSSINIENEILAHDKNTSPTMDVGVDVDVSVKKTDPSGEVINLDEDTDDGLHSFVNMEEQAVTKPAECITINEESEELPGKDKYMQEDSETDDSNNRVESREDGKLYIVDDNPQAQEIHVAEEKLNGIDENSGNNLRMDISDEEDIEKDNQRTANVDGTECEKLQVTHSSGSPAWYEKPSLNFAATIDADSFNDPVKLSGDDGRSYPAILFFKNEHTSSNVPKLNGEHKTPETDRIKTVIDMLSNAEAVEDRSHFSDQSYVKQEDDADDNNGNSSNLEIVDENSKDSFSKEGSCHTDEVSRSPHSRPLLLNESDDEASRFSMASTQSSSTATSSSHQLVIDHPSDDIETPVCYAPLSSIQANSQNFPLLPLKISLKRKLSQSDEEFDTTAPHQKLPHLESNEEELCESFDNKESVESQRSPILNGENSEQVDFVVKSRSSSPALRIAETTIEMKTEAVGINSEVTQAAEYRDNVFEAAAHQIEVPKEGENQDDPMELTIEKTHEDVRTSPARSSPLLNSLLLKKIPQQLSEKFDNFATPNKPRKTKYLCFNCKSGSFNSLSALNEHQNICLANKILISDVSASTQANATTISTQQHTSIAPVSPQQPMETETLHFGPPSQNQPIAVTPIEKRVYYQCASCKTYHENWNLFLHIREIHKRHTCLYCIRMFPTAEKLSLHLEIKHDLEQNHFNSEEALRKSIKIIDGSISETRFLMCCTCQHVFLENENFSDHVCTEFIPACMLCGQKGRHTNQCKAQNEAKRSKVKKKSKVKDSRTSSKSLPPESSLQSSTASKVSHSESASNNPHILTSNCDNAQPALLHGSFQPSTTAVPAQALQQQLHHDNEDSNSSCNMVIDETCNSSNYGRITAYNPPNAQDEKERLEQETNLAQPVLPPDRSQVGDVAAEKPEPVQPLIVPKFKLRVPKEFQKSVDAVISSSESEEDEELVINEDEANKSEAQHLRTSPHPDMDVESNSLRTSEQPASQDMGEECSKQSSGGVDDDDSLDEPNSNLVRILQEIERTKLDIMRTKDALHTSSKTPSSVGQRQATISQSSSRTGDRNWTPTPPASPNAHWYTPRQGVMHGDGIGAADAKLKRIEVSRELSPEATSQPMLTAMPIQREKRRNTTGSDMDMDIDETISGQPVQCIERPSFRAAENDEEKMADVSNDSTVGKLNVSSDSSFTNVDVVSKSNAEETNKTSADKDDKSERVDEKITANKTPPHSEAKLGESMETRQYTLISDKETPIKQEDLNVEIECSDKDENENNETSQEPQSLPSPALPVSTTPAPPADGIIVADEETISVDLQLDRPLEKFEIIEFVRICLKAVYPLCLYCNHARRIAVNGKSLVLHLIAQHRFAATVDSITAEELKPNTIVAKLKSYLPELEEQYFNSNSYCTFGEGAFTHPFNERIFECFQCRFVTSTHKELYLHNRKMHLKTAILCFMCRSNFFSFSEILCHVCPGESHKISVFDIKFRCCLCDVDNIPSPFRLMVHLRKKHFACDVCLEDCRDQGRLSSHVWKHKLHHLCYRCGIAYRNKMDITKHLFWKHGTESIICKRCLQKRWRHVYHFCIPPANFTCDICNLCFSKATYLKVHKRIHTGDLRYPCTDENCEQKFISRRLLLKHTAEHQLTEMNESQAEAGEKDSTEQQHTPAGEVKEEQQSKLKEEEMEDDKEPSLKVESKVGTEQCDTKSESVGESKKNDSADMAKLTDINDEEAGNSSCKQRKKKKSKRNKESLEDLNLIAPNLSESDSSEDSDIENKSKSGDDSLVPKVILSPASDTDLKEDEASAKIEPHSDPKVLDIWKNLMQAQGADTNGESLETGDPTDYTEDYYPTPLKLHVAQSDHDYCVMFKPEQAKLLLADKAPSKASPHKRKTGKSPRHSSTRRSDASSGSSSSGSSSDSSCSCGSNCSCSSSNSGSSSSSSSSNDSDDSSGASHASRKRHRKKSERDRMRKKSESLSPMKKHNMSEGSGKSLLGVDVDVGTEDAQPVEEDDAAPKEPLFYESDLETAESDTDEEFYDEHPQKLATELLAQKRAQLMAQTRLSPSHNFDIVENSRPSTPSLPDEVARERKVKLKKKKRERKSTSRSVATGTGVPPLKLNLGAPASPNRTQVPEPDILSATTQPMMTVNSAPAKDPSYDLKRGQSFGIAEISISTQQQQHHFNTTVHTVAGQPLTPRPIGPQHHLGRMSEGSSCSDADGSLKRSKRARRPNKFYGYTSDEEHNMSGLGQPVLMGMRAIKPQPPPQLTWRKEDLPTPSKSIINNNKMKNPRIPKTPNTPLSTQAPVGSLFNANFSGPVSNLLKKNRVARGSANAKNRKRNPQKGKVSSKMPPIPTLKIRSSQIGLTPNQHMSTPTAGSGGGTNHIPASQIYSSSKESDEEDDDEVDSTDSSSDEDASQRMVAPSISTTKVAWNSSLLQAPAATPNAPVAALILPKVAPAPPTPQAVAFNQKIPPALLPNPDFATLQYFKANNIRYPIRPPAGARQAREGESVYCYCRCPYDEVSEMIACDGENCLIEWFHFECVGIMVAPQGKWFCAECRPKYSEELYPTAGTA